MTSVGILASRDHAVVSIVPGDFSPRVIARTATSASVALVSRRMLLLGGDEVALSFDVGPGCVLEIVDVASTVAYSSASRLSTWRTRVRVRPGGLFLWNCLPFIVADDAAVDRTMDVVLDEGARACVRETVVFGRVAEAGGLLRSRFEASLGGHPLLVEKLDADGRSGDPGILGAHRVVDTIMLLGARRDEEQRTVPTATSFELEGVGSLARYLGAEAHLSPISGLWHDWRVAAQTVPSDGRTEQVLACA